MGCLGTHEQQIVCTALTLYEFLEILPLQYPAEHFKKTDEIRLAGTVCADQQGHLRQFKVFDSDQIAETFDADLADTPLNRALRLLGDLFFCFHYTSSHIRWAKVSSIRRTRVLALPSLGRAWLPLM